jgi:predicted O-methyltransferase YrrM
MLARMKALEEINARDRTDGTPHSRRLRQVSPQTGRFLALLAASAPPGQIIEIGTSAGYSTLWLATACRATGRAITTFEVSPEKARLAQETFALAGVEDAVVLVVGDARDHLARYPDVAFCFLDAEKDIYGDCYELVIPNLVRGGLLAADNVTSHRGPLQSMLDRALSDARADAVIVPIGQGVLVCRKA